MWSEGTAQGINGQGRRNGQRKREENGKIFHMDTGQIVRRDSRQGGEDLAEFVGKNDEKVFGEDSERSIQDAGDCEKSVGGDAGQSEDDFEEGGKGFS